jgi:hypothetical protein
LIRHSNGFSVEPRTMINGRPDRLRHQTVDAEQTGEDPLVELIPHDSDRTAIALQQLRVGPRYPRAALPAPATRR